MEQDYPGVIARIDNIKPFVWQAGKPMRPAVKIPRIGSVISSAGGGKAVITCFARKQSPEPSRPVEVYALTAAHALCKNNGQSLAPGDGIFCPPHKPLVDPLDRAACGNVAFSDFMASQRLSAGSVPRFDAPRLRDLAAVSLSETIRSSSDFAPATLPDGTHLLGLAPREELRRGAPVMRVKEHGSVTGLIDNPDVTVILRGANAETLLCTGLVAITPSVDPFSKPGDSGGVVLISGGKYDRHAIGPVVAGAQEWLDDEGKANGPPLSYVLPVFDQLADHKLELLTE